MYEAQDAKLEHIFAEVDPRSQYAAASRLRRMPWTAEILDPSFSNWFKSLSEYQQAVLDAAIEHVLVKHGPEICQGEFGKNLKDGLYEFRVRQSLRAIKQYGGIIVPDDAPGIQDETVALRVFCHFYDGNVVLLVSGLDKKASAKAQDKEIARAKKLVRKFTDDREREKKKAEKAARDERSRKMSGPSRTR
jgi:UDP-N-acetylmuramoylalanine-D-glutamate ligase